KNGHGGADLCGGLLLRFSGFFGLLGHDISPFKKNGSIETKIVFSPAYTLRASRCQPNCADRSPEIDLFCENRRTHRPPLLLAFSRWNDRLKRGRRGCYIIIHSTAEILYVTIQAFGRGGDHGGGDLITSNGPAGDLGAGL